MSKIEFFIPFITVTLFSLSIIWLIPKNFNIDMAAGKMFMRLTRFRPVTKEICDMVAEFKEEYSKSYYKNLAIFSLFYIVFIILLAAFIYYVIFTRG